ncbi:MAG: class I SAM-dependent methyltransferase [candidate division Zixibacteria bacterium]|nr:class I SAM-dependent methyltransferase [candidate division Zixibacteria bacterium]
MAERVCPVWVGYLLASPLRKLIENPDKILSDYIKPNMTVLDVGCAMGYFTLAAAKLNSPGGKVIAVDLQQKMINSLNRRISRTNLTDRIETRVCTENSLKIDDLIGQIDFALAFYVVHEVPDPEKLFNQIYKSLKPGGQFLIAEPRGHITADQFKTSIDLALKTGFEFIENPKIKRARTCLLQKN